MPKLRTLAGDAAWLKECSCCVSLVCIMIPLVETKWRRFSHERRCSAEHCTIVCTVAIMRDIREFHKSHKGPGGLRLLPSRTIRACIDCRTSRKAKQHAKAHY